MKIENELGETIRRARLQKQLSQAQLAQQLGVTQATISHAESGLDLKISTLVEIARALELEPILAPRNLVSAIHALTGASRAQRNALVHEAGDNSPYYESLDNATDAMLPLRVAPPTRFYGGGKAIPIAENKP